MCVALLILMCSTVWPPRATGDVHLDVAEIGASHHVVFIVPTGPAGSVAADDSSRARVFRWLVNDIGALGKAVFTPRFALYAAGTLGGTFALAWSDDDLTDVMNDLYVGTARDVFDAMYYMGGPHINLPVVALAGGSMLTNNIKFQDAAFTSLQTLVYAGLLGYALKGIFGRARPENTDPYDPYAFFETTGMNPFSGEGNSSYPSGHAISAFGILTPWVLYYPNPLTYGLYVIPTGAALSRVAVDKHWPTDLVVGAAIGIAMGRWLTKRHRRDEPDEGRVSLSFANEGKLFSLRVSLE